MTKELPPVNWDWGLNRSDPLQTWRSGVETIGNDVGTFRRLRTLDNCLKYGPMRVGFYPRKNPTTHGSYLITIFDENFVIPKHIAEYWMLLLYITVLQKLHLTCPQSEQVLL
jgi:hypothetical protein